MKDPYRDDSYALILQLIILAFLGILCLLAIGRWLSHTPEGQRFQEESRGEATRVTTSATYPR